VARGALPLSILVALFSIVAHQAAAHPMVDDGLDVVIGQNELTITARISPEEIAVANNLSASTQPATEMSRNHGTYVLRHLRVEADDRSIEGREVPASPASEHVYHFEYPLTRSPRIVRLYQTLLIDHPPWTASCIVRFRQANENEFQTALLTSQGTAEFNCEWPGTSHAASQPATHTAVRIGPTFRAYFAHGVKHILTGYDHLLFISALVLAATSLWDLVKVVTAFTLAHTLTLTLSIFNLVTLGERIVEPMIAASIVIVALQNIFWPRSSRGWPRLAIAFAFGLFHGLGFAGGLKVAMLELPRSALWVSLIGFSVGVEVGHQVVVVPLFATLTLPKNPASGTHVARIASAAIALAGTFFVIQAFNR
jgi:hydrogenase/urease accessory protein HupE